jgi:TPR repeat protein
VAQDFDSLPHDPVPIFLAEQSPRYEPTPEFSFGRRTKRSRGSRIVTGLFALAAALAILALVSADSTRAVIVNAKALLASGAPLPLVGAQQQDATAPAPRLAAIQPANAEPAATRDEIAAAYQSAIKSRVVAIEPAAAEPTSPARRIEPDELAALLKRAKGLLAIGDIISARLLLERAADAQEADAALMLAGTYDPQVLGARDMRSITPDPATARLWYQKAAELGSPDAKRRLSQIQN